MRLPSFLVCAVLCVLQVVYSQSDVLSPHSVSFVPAPSATPALPTETDVTPHSVSFVPNPAGTAALATETDVTPHPVTFVPAPESTAVTASSTHTNKGKIAGAVVGGVAAIVASIGAFILLRMRAKQSKRHWRNRAGTWQDPEGKPSGGQVYAGQPLDRPFDAYSRDSKISAGSPTTPTAAPLFIREPRIGNPFSSSRRRDDSMEMSPTSEATRF
ncbi:hypothetical protein C8F04DRAFT_1064818 [Mycena alexandri]|uniref:Transmembrane protein n=1 Tax=Mycena alexandri TaxID=1745969 RepID=A0AAD6TF55_9AGAR|nr:hypothetical protein C8F04DRAFT_1064818 [Mycena alexandri]